MCVCVCVCVVDGGIKSVVATKVYIDLRIVTDYTNEIMCVCVYMCVSFVCMCVRESAVRIYVHVYK